MNSKGLDICCFFLPLVMLWCATTCAGSVPVRALFHQVDFFYRLATICLLSVDLLVVLSNLPMWFECSLFCGQVLEETAQTLVMLLVLCARRLPVQCIERSFQVKFNNRSLTGDSALLDAICDAVVELDDDLWIVDPATSFANR